MQRDLGDERGAADVLVNLGTVALDRGDYPRSAALFEESLPLRRKLGDRWGIALALTTWGWSRLPGATSPKPLPCAKTA